MERVTAAQAPQRETTATPCAVHLNSLQCVSTAGWQEPAAWHEQRADEAAVPEDRRDENPGGGRWPFPVLALHDAHHRRRIPPCRRSKVPSTRSRSAARSAWRAVAARGLARTTSRLPPGSDPRYPRAR